MQHFEYIDDKSPIYWEIDRQGQSVSVRYGRLGTNGRTKEKR